MRTLGDEMEKQGFDLKVHHRDKKTGQITHINPYKLRIVGEDRLRLFERPVGSGNLWNGQNIAVGRWIEEKDEKGRVKSSKYDPNAEHIAYTAPLTADQKLAQENAKVASENEALRKELAAMKAEQEKESAPKGAKGKNDESKGA